MKQLPKYFYIKRQKDNLLWDKYIKWLWDTYGEKWYGTSDNYYGYDGSTLFKGTNHYKNPSFFYNNPVELSLEEWDSIVNPKPLTLQDEFIIDTQETTDLCNHPDGDGVFKHWNWVKWPFKTNQYWNIFEYVPKDLPIITYKQFISMQEKQIIGYKAPCDLFGGTIKKDTLYTLRTPQGVSYKNSLEPDNQFHVFPKEIVETWEKVFKQEELVVELGTPKKKITIRKDYFEHDYKAITTEQITNLVTNMNGCGKINSWTVAIPAVKIGCSTFTREELESLIKQQQSL